MILGGRLDFTKLKDLSNLVYTYNDLLSFNSFKYCCSYIFDASCRFLSSSCIFSLLLFLIVTLSIIFGSFSFYDKTFNNYVIALTPYFSLSTDISSILWIISFILSAYLISYKYFVICSMVDLGILINSVSETELFFYKFYFITLNKYINIYIYDLQRFLSC